MKLSLLSLVHFRLDLLWSKSVHQLQGLGDKLWILIRGTGFADVYLLIVSLISRSKINANKASGRGGDKLQRELVMGNIPQEHQSHTSLSSLETQA